jgi:hypothetical protein
MGRVRESRSRLAWGPPSIASLASRRFWTIAIEGLIALLFLAPLSRRWKSCRDIALLTFCATTYPFATVAGFGWLLVAMGIAQCARQRVGTRLAYVGMFLLILGYRELSLATWLVGQ